jgi:Xaa-Pro aminopeptidase
MKPTRVFTGMILTLSTALAWGQTPFDASEYQAHRKSLMEKAPDGVVLLHAVTGRKRWDEAGFHQDPNFDYFTGLQNLHGAILAVDGATKQSWLFVMTPTQKQRDQVSDLQHADSVYLESGHQAESEFGIEHVLPWEEFVGFIEAQRKSNPKLVLYLDDGGSGNLAPRISNPLDLLPMENPYLLWSVAIKQKWPDVSIGNASPLTRDIRAVKNPAEITAMKTAARYTVAGFWAGAAAVKLGNTQSQVESAAIRGALFAGADGVSMWPVVQSGPGGSFAEKFQVFHSGDHILRAGETLTMDVGFDAGAYKGDLGRTFPVSGHFSKEQREVLTLLNGAYRAGLHALRDGTTSEDLIKACTQFVVDHQGDVKTDFGRRAIQKLLDPSSWITYTHGTEMVEVFAPKVLHTGNTLAFAPEFNLGDQRFYIEDVLLITQDGYELINPPLPYSPDDIETAMHRHASDDSRPR